MQGHSGTILKIIPLEPERLVDCKYKNMKDSAKIITASLDNTIILWDYEKNDIISKVECPQATEMTACAFCYKSYLVASGHEIGNIRIWNLEINSCVLLKFS